MLETKMKKLDITSVIIFISIMLLDGLVWYEVIFLAPPKNSEFHVLDVSQGDSELIILPGGVKVMTDAGVGSKVLSSLEKAIASSDKYIDIAIISHPQLDHFEGYRTLIDRYQFGLFIINGRSDGGVGEWYSLIEKINDKKIPIITLEEGDRILYGPSRIEILSPNEDWLQSGELNDTGFVELIKTPDFSTLLMADIGFNVEKDLIKKYDIRVDILKVGHHGSKYSSSEDFLRAVNPRIAVIGVGAKNTYGHPSEETLERLSSVDAKVFRTDQNGNIRILAKEGKLKVFAER
jgi:competence protein ComEC